jgi:hypothetical protein
LEIAWAPQDDQIAACCIYMLCFRWLYQPGATVCSLMAVCSLMQNFRHKNSGDPHQGTLHTLPHQPASQPASQPARLVPRKTAVRQPASWPLPPSSCTAHCWTHILEPFVSCACRSEFDNDFLAAWLAVLIWICFADTSWVQKLEKPKQKGPVQEQ